MERSHSQRLIELTTRHHQELEKETGRLRTANQQAERVLEAKERAHRQRVKELEEQVCVLYACFAPSTKDNLLTANHSMLSPKSDQ